MEDPGIARFRRWFDHERRAHALVFASLESVPDDHRDGPEYRRALSLLGHLIAARQIWLVRLGLGGAPPSAFFPEDVDLAGLAVQAEDVEGRWAEYLAGLDDDALSGYLEYQSADAGRFRSRIDDVLAQLSGHSWYHRGQIAMLVRAAGGTPAVTDLIYLTREPCDGAP